MDTYVMVILFWQTFKQPYAVTNIPHYSTLEECEKKAEHVNKIKVPNLQNLRAFCVLGPNITPNINRGHHNLEFGKKP